MKGLPPLVVATLALPTTALAAGLDLTWNDCVGASNASDNKTFACSGTANQSYDLVIQFKTSLSLGAAAAITALIDLETDLGAMTVTLILSRLTIESVDGAPALDLRPPFTKTTHTATINGVSMPVRVSTWGQLKAAYR